uniref:Uncharacterized protein MANES_15G160700 n=2 Tax=Rhizophora mucronata TaxID=61149 RepID=A0A2P2K9S4_RHIMU
MRNSVNRPPTPDAVEIQQKRPTLEEIINIKLIESGEKERLMELLRERLTECGWKDDMKSLCRFSLPLFFFFSFSKGSIFACHYLADGTQMIFSEIIE